jgi:hypothetical protein
MYELVPPLTTIAVTDKDINIGHNSTSNDNDNDNGNDNDKNFVVNDN